MNAAKLVKLESKRAKRDRAKKGGETGGVGRPKDNSLETTSVSKLKPKKERTRKAVANRIGVSERSYGP